MKASEFLNAIWWAVTHVEEAQFENHLKEQAHQLPVGWEFAPTR
jgi:hypothetical protein